MAKTIQITIQTAADLKGIRDAQKALADISKGGNASPAKGYNDQAKAANQAAIAAQRLAQAEQRTAQSASAAAVAQQRVATATAQAAAAQTRAEQAALRLAQAQHKAANPSQTLTSLFGQLSTQLSGIGGTAGQAAGAIGNLAGSLGTVGAVGAALGIGKVAVDLSIAGANADLVRQRFDGLAVSAGTTGEALLNALRSASGGEISDLNLQLAANKAQLLGVADSAAEFSTLMAIARDRAQQMGISTTQAFNDLVTGLGRGSALILDNLGITISVTEANEAYAASLGKSAEALTEAESKTALINAVLAQGQASLDATGGAVESRAATFARFGTVVENATSSLGNFLAGGLEPIAAQAVATADATSGLIDWLGQLGTVTAADQAATAAYTAEMERSGSVALANAAYEAAHAAALTQTATATQQATVATLDSTNAQMAYANSLEMADIQARAAAAAAQMKSQADQVAAVDAQTHRLAEEQLALQAQAAAQSLLNAGAAGANAAAQLANSSSHVDVLTAAYYRLAAAQAAANQAKTNAAALSDQRAGERDAGSSRTFKEIEFAAQQDRRAQASRVRRAEEAERALKKLAGGAGRISAAQQAATKLEGIEVKTGDKIAEIVQDTQEKITGIMEREAAKQQAALQKLNESIALAGADRRASAEADDLDLIGVDDPEQAAKLNAREAAQAKARAAEERAAEEARAVALAGDAELAQKQFEIREKQIGDQQSLDEKYAEKQRELAGNEEALAAAQTQYDEATRANEEAAQRRIEFAQLESAQKKQAVEDEKAGVIAAAEDQANKVISAAERSAQGVAKASQTAKDTATANLKAIGDAVNAIPSQKTITITVSQTGTVGASSGGGTGNKSAGGGNFLTHGPTKLTVGDNPGGVELVTVTPLSGKGQTRTDGSLLKLAGGGVVVVDAGDGYTTPVAGGPTKKGGGKKGKGGTPAPADNKAIREAIKESIELIKLQNELRNVQAEAQRKRPMPINFAWVEGLATESQEIARIVTSKILPLKKEEAEAFGKYASAVGQATDILKNIADLRTMQAKAKTERPGELVMAYIKGLAIEAAQITQLVRDHLIPSTEFESEMYAAYADAVSSAVSVLSDVADLRKKLTEPTPPIDIRYINQLVADAAVVTVIARDHLLPTTEEQAEALGLYADAVGSSVGILKDVSELTSDMFSDYVSPSDAQIGVLVNDAKRLSQGFIDAAKVMDTKALEAAKLYTETLGQVFTNTKDQLEVTDRIRFSDLTVDPKNLAMLEESGAMILDTVAAIGKRASLIPAADLTAMNNATAAIKSYSEAMVTLAAVPFGNLPQMSIGMGGGGPVTNYITVQAAPGMDITALATKVADVINQRTGARR